jgi:hypothetical protein
MDNVQRNNVLLTYHRHRLADLIYKLASLSLSDVYLPHRFDRALAGVLHRLGTWGQMQTGVIRAPALWVQK